MGHNHDVVSSSLAQTTISPDGMDFRQDFYDIIVLLDPIV